MKMTACIILGLVSVVASELLVLFGLSEFDTALDITANLLLTIVPGVILVVAIIMALILFRVFASNPKRYIAAYLITWMTAYAVALNLMGNPLADIAHYVLTVAVVGGAVLAAGYVLFWRFNKPS